MNVHKILPCHTTLQRSYTLQSHVQLRLGRKGTLVKVTEIVVLFKDK